MALDSAFRRLRVWTVSLDLVEHVYKITAQFPVTERFGLAAQLRRAAISVAANIAEGNSRLSTGAYLNHINIALGSVGELCALVEIATRLQLVSNEDAAPLAARLDELGRLLYGLRKSIAARMNSS